MPKGSLGVLSGLHEWSRIQEGMWGAGARWAPRLVLSGPLASALSGPMYRVSDDMVVHLPRAVDASNAKDHEDHGPCIHQRPHCWLPAASVHAGVEAKGSRETGLGHCRGSDICTGRQGPTS